MILKINIFIYHASENLWFLQTTILLSLLYYLIYVNVSFSKRDLYCFSLWSIDSFLPLRFERTIPLLLRGEECPEVYENKLARGQRIQKPTMVNCQGYSQKTKFPDTRGSTPPPPHQSRASYNDTIPSQSNTLLIRYRGSWPRSSYSVRSSE
jgi:hypothetical protein